MSTCQKLLHTIPRQRFTLYSVSNEGPQTQVKKKAKNGKKKKLRKKKVRTMEMRKELRILTQNIRGSIDNQ